MGVPLVLNAARTLVAGSLVLSLGLAPASAHMALPAGGPVGHAGFTLGHGRPLTEPGFGRVGSFVLSGRNGYGWDNRGRSPWYGWGRSSWYGWSRYGRIGRGWNGWGPYGLDGWSAYSGFWGPGYWASAGDAGSIPQPPAVAVAGGPTLVSINVYSGAADPGEHGSCVIHRLEYDGAGHYVGERETPYC